VTPDILILGQITVDDTVPANPGPWQRRLGGNALYAAAGARLWCEPGRIGIVARVSTGLSFDVRQILEAAGLSADGLVPVDVQPLVEWIVYEEDGNRQSFPRNPELRDPSASVEELHRRYLAYLESLSASWEDIPANWLPAKAIHLSPQVLPRHGESCRALASQTDFLSVDPSPHYSRSRNPSDLVKALPGITAFLPSQAEVQHLAETYPNWPSAVRALQQGGFEEVVLKRGRADALLAVAGSSEVIPVPAATASPVDLTGAGDAFSGAYAACRAIGYIPQDAVSRAVVGAAMIVECSGTVEALALTPQRGEVLLHQYLDALAKGKQLKDADRG
jgi:sugar/nucleoside kinase (ribokinase family)